MKSSQSIEIALEYLKASPAFSNYIFGRWWNKEEEIDVVGLDSNRNRIIFGEVKWKHLSEKNARQVLNRLVEKSVEVKWEKGKIQAAAWKNSISSSEKKLKEKGAN